MKKVSKLIEEHLRENNLSYDERECGNADKGFLVAYGGSNVGMHCGIQVYEDQRRLGISIFSGAKAVPERLPLAYELAARLNSIVAIGAFCVVPDAGDISLDIGASALDVDVTDMWIGSLICTGLHTYDHYFPAIAGVFYSGQQPVEALAIVDGPSDDEVVDTVARLLSDAGEAATQPTTDEDPLDETRNLWDDDEQDNSAEDEPSDSPEIRIQLPKLPKIIAQIAPQDIADVLREIRGEARQNPEDEGQSGGQDAAAA